MLLYVLIRIVEMSRTDKSNYYTQQSLCDPTPMGTHNIAYSAETIFT